MITENVQGVTYIHYGSRHFDPKRFVPVANISFWIKPRGGFWASRVDAPFSWKDWNEDSNYMSCIASNAVRFTMDNARVLVIRSLEQLMAVAVIYGTVEENGLSGQVRLDFERLKSVCDAVEVFISADQRLYWALYGWDCDSVVVLNPDVIKEVLEDNEKSVL